MDQTFYVFKTFGHLNLPEGLTLQQQEVLLCNDYEKLGFVVSALKATETLNGRHVFGVAVAAETEQTQLIGEMLHAGRNWMRAQMLDQLGAVEARCRTLPKPPLGPKPEWARNA